MPSCPSGPSKVSFSACSRMRRRYVVARAEAAAHVAGADAQLHHDGQAARFGQLEAGLDNARHETQVRTRIEQADRRLEREGEAPLLDHAGTLAIVLADDDEGTARDPGRGKIGQGIGGDVGPHHRFPRDRATHWVVDRCGQQRRRRGFIRAGLDVDPEFVEQAASLHEDVEQVRDRRSLIAPDIGHAGLEQPLGDGENAFAMEGLTGA